MPDLLVYGDSRSGNCLKVRWTAERLGIPFEWREVSVAAGETRTPAFFALNPWGQVPAVRLGDGRVLTQSNAIIAHLAEGSALTPADAFARARVFEWLFWEQYSHEPAIAVRRYRKVYQNLPDPEIEPALLEKGQRALAHLDDALAGRPYLVGEALTIADIALVAYTRWAPEGGFDLTGARHVLTWIARVERDLGLPQTQGAP
ncbi:MAG: glutathione S-transferase family protein [Hyphomonadaceae bacterium]|nr:glutathione S-transferase family protein [Hyphomonadaceae bacterium]